MGLSQVSILLPEGILQNVGDDNSLFAVHGRAARSLLRPDRKPVDGSNERLGQARSGAVPHMLSVVVEEKDRTKHAGELDFHNSHQPLKDFLQRSVSRYHLQNTALSVPQGLRPLALGYIHQGTYDLDDLARLVHHGVRDRMKVFYASIRKNNSPIKLRILLP